MPNPEYENQSVSEYGQWIGRDTRPRGDNYDQWSSVKNFENHNSGLPHQGSGSTLRERQMYISTPPEKGEFSRPGNQDLNEVVEGKNWVDTDLGWKLRTQEDAIMMALYGRGEGFYDDSEMNMLEESWIDAEDYVAINSTYTTVIQLATIVFLTSVLFLSSITEQTFMVGKSLTVFVTTFFLALSILLSSFGGLTLLILHLNYAKLDSRYSQNPHNDGTQHNPVGHAVMKQAIRNSQGTRMFSELAVKSSVILLVLSVSSSVFMHRAIGRETWVVATIGTLVITGSVLGLLWIVSLAFLNEDLQSKRRTVIGKDMVFDSDILRELNDDMSRDDLLRHFTSPTRHEMKVLSSCFGLRQVLVDREGSDSEELVYDVEAQPGGSTKLRVTARNGSNWTNNPNTGRR